MLRLGAYVKKGYVSLIFTLRQATSGAEGLGMEFLIWRLDLKNYFALPLPCPACRVPVAQLWWWTSSLSRFRHSAFRFHYISNSSFLPNQLTKRINYQYSIIKWWKRFLAYSHRCGVLIHILSFLIECNLSSPSMDRGKSSGGLEMRGLRQELRIRPQVCPTYLVCTYTQYPL